MFSYEIYLSCICYLWYLWVLVLYNISEALCIFLRFYESVFYRYFLVYYFLSVVWDNSESVIFFRYPHMTDLWVCVCVSFIYSSVSLNKITLTHVHCLQWVCVERLRFAGCGATSQRTHHSGGSSAVNKSGGSPRQQSTNKSSVTWLGAASWLVERFMKQ